MAKYSMKKGGKEVGPAEIYAEPHTMTGKKVTVATALMDKKGKECMNEMNISTGTISKGNYPEAKSTGIEMRGAGAATKGRMCRGPMA